MDQDLVVPDNSTNVRAQRGNAWPLRTVRAGFRVLSPAMPGLAARWAEHLFFTPRRHVRPAWELEVLERAERFSVTRGGKHALAAWSWGRGARTVLLVHGWEGRGAQLGKLVEPLVDAGFRVVAFDAPGHGDTGGKRASPMHFARAIERVEDELGDGDAIVAHSMGALGTSLAMSRRDSIRRLVYIAPSIGPERYESTFASVLGLDAGVRARMQRRIEEHYAMRMDDLRATRLAARVTARLLVVHDRDDSEVPWEDGAALADAWPSAELFTTSGLGHRRILKDAAVIDRTVAFVRSREV